MYFLYTLLIFYFTVYEIIAQQQRQTVAVILVTKKVKGPVFSKIIVALLTVLKGWPFKTLNYRLETATDIGCHFSKKRKLKGRPFKMLLFIKLSLENSNKHSMSH